MIGARIGPYLSDTPQIVHAFAPFLKGDTTPDGVEPLNKDSLQAAFAQATRGLAGERPTIVLIDDLHFAPDEGRALFASLALACPGHRILLVGTLRPGVSADWIAEIDRLTHSSHLALRRLEASDVADLLKEAFHSDELARQLGPMIAVKADGNPFFTFEIIRDLRESDALVQGPDGTWSCTQPIRTIEIPSTVMDLIRVRIDALQDDERQILEVAACCGFTFDPELVGEVLGVGPIEALQRFARIEKHHRLVRSAGAKYVFDHHQVQEALRLGLHERLRTRYHEGIARSLEAREGAAAKDVEDLDGALCLELCEHYIEGGCSREADWYLDAAVDHLLKSVHTSMSAWHSGQAASLVERARRLRESLGLNEAG